MFLSTMQIAFHLVLLSHNMGEGGSECVSQLIKFQTVRTAAILSETQKTAQTDDKKGINSTAIEKLSHF